MFLSKLFNVYAMFSSAFLLFELKFGILNIFINIEYSSIMNSSWINPINVAKFHKLFFHFEIHPKLPFSSVWSNPPNKKHECSTLLLSACGSKWDRRQACRKIFMFIDMRVEIEKLCD